jgi:hypothetical protein
VNQFDAALSCLHNFDLEFGCDTTSFFSRSDDRLKLEEKLAFRVCRIETKKSASQERRETNILMRFERETVRVVPTMDHNISIPFSECSSSSSRCEKCGEKSGKVIE